MRIAVRALHVQHEIERRISERQALSIALPETQRREVAVAPATALHCRGGEVDRVKGRRFESPCDPFRTTPASTADFQYAQPTEGKRAAGRCHVVIHLNVPAMRLVLTPEIE